MDAETLSRNPVLFLVAIVMPIMVICFWGINLFFATQYKDQFARRMAIFWGSILLGAPIQSIGFNFGQQVTAVSYAGTAVLSFSTFVYCIQGLTSLHNRTVLNWVSLILGWTLFCLGLSAAGVPLQVWLTLLVLIQSFTLIVAAGLIVKNRSDRSWPRIFFATIFLLFGFHTLTYPLTLTSDSYRLYGFVVSFGLFLLIGIASLVIQVETWVKEVQVKDLLHGNARLAAAGEVAAEIAHEIRNPLQIILGKVHLNNCKISENTGSQTLVLSEKDFKSLKNDFETIERMSQRIEQIIRGLNRLISSGENDTRSDFNIHQQFEDLKQLLKSKLRKSGALLRLIVAPEAAQTKLQVNSVQIGQVLTNLVSNAADALEDLKSPNPWIEVRATLSSDRMFLKIDVVDAGNGIPEEIREKIFETLFTTKKDGRGTGLGLGLSRRIARSHGGDLVLVPVAPNTTFSLTLPLEKTN